MNFLIQVRRGARSKRNRIRRLAKIFIPREYSETDAKNVDGGKKTLIQEQNISQSRNQSIGRNNLFQSDVDTMEMVR